MSETNGTTPMGGSEPPIAEPVPSDPVPGPAPVAANGGASTDVAPPPVKPAPAKKRPRRSPWLTVGVVAVVLLVLAGIGFFAGWDRSADWARRATSSRRTRWPACRGSPTRPSATDYSLTPPGRR